MEKKRKFVIYAAAAALLLVPSVLFFNSYQKSERERLRKLASQYGIEANLFSSGRVSCEQRMDDMNAMLDMNRKAYACRKDADCVLLRTDEGYCGLTYASVNCAYGKIAIKFFGSLMQECASDQSLESYKRWSEKRPVAVCEKSFCTVKEKPLD